MMRIAFVLMVALATLSSAVAQDVVETGTAQVAFGWVRGPDGKKHSIAGLRLPYVSRMATGLKGLVLNMRRAKIARSPKSALGTGRQRLLSDLPSLSEGIVSPHLLATLNPVASRAARPLFDTTVYSAEDGPTGGYGVLEETDPSSLDDHVLAGGAGKLWKNLTFGVQINAQRAFIAQWTVYDNYVTGRGHDVHAFDGIIADFAVIWPASTPNENPRYITIDVAPQTGFPGVTCPDDSIYMSQEFRLVQPPSYPYDVEQKNVYHISSAPLVGSSENNFWYNWDPLNSHLNGADPVGTFAEDELEVLGPPELAPFSNLLRTITISGTQHILPPISEFLATGVYVSGDVFSLQDSDDEKYTFKPSWNVSRTSPNGALEVQGTSPTTSVNSFRFAAEVSASTAGGNLRTELWNWNTSAWEILDTRTIPSTDTLVQVNVPSNFGRFINATNRRVKSRLAFFSPNTVGRTYRLFVDQVFWTVTTP